MKIIEKIKFFFCLLFFLSVQSCTASDFTTQHFSFPQESKAHESNWQYLGFIKVTSIDGQEVTKKSKKEILVKIVDRKDQTLLSDKMVFNAASVKSNIAWKSQEKIVIEFLETGNKYTADDYNRHLLKSGPRQLAIIYYEYDTSTKLYHRAN